MYDTNWDWTHLPDHCRIFYPLRQWAGNTHTIRRVSNLFILQSLFLEGWGRCYRKKTHLLGNKDKLLISGLFASIKWCDICKKKRLTEVAHQTIEDLTVADANLSMPYFWEQHLIIVCRVKSARKLWIRTRTWLFMKSRMWLTRNLNSNLLKIAGFHLGFHLDRTLRSKSKGDD